MSLIKGAHSQTVLTLIDVVDTFNSLAIHVLNQPLKVYRRWSQERLDKLFVKINTSLYYFTQHGLETF